MKRIASAVVLAVGIVMVGMIFFQGGEQSLYLEWEETTSPAESSLPPAGADREPAEREPAVGEKKGDPPLPAQPGGSGATLPVLAGLKEMATRLEQRFQESGFSLRWYDWQKEEVEKAMVEIFGLDWESQLQKVCQDHGSDETAAFIIYLFGCLERPGLENHVLKLLERPGAPDLFCLYNLTRAGSPKAGLALSRLLRDQWKNLELDRKAHRKTLERIYTAFARRSPLEAGAYFLDRFGEEENPVERKFFLQCLSGVAEPKTIHRLSKALVTEPSATLRQAGLRVVATLDDDSAVEPLSAFLKTDPAHEVRAHAASLLATKFPIGAGGCFGAFPRHRRFKPSPNKYLSPGAFDSIDDYLYDEHRNIYGGGRSLSHISESGAWQKGILDPLLESLRSDPHAKVRLAALKAIMVIHSYLELESISKELRPAVLKAARSAVLDLGPGDDSETVRNLAEKMRKKWGW